MVSSIGAAPRSPAETETFVRSPGRAIRAQRADIHSSPLSARLPSDEGPALTRSRISTGETDDKGAPIQVPDVFAIDAGRFVRVQGSTAAAGGRLRNTGGPWFRVVALLTAVAVESQRVDLEAGPCFPK